MKWNKAARRPHRTSTASSITVMSVLHLAEGLMASSAGGMTKLLLSGNHIPSPKVYVNLRRHKGQRWSYCNSTVCHVTSTQLEVVYFPFQKNLSLNQSVVNSVCQQTAWGEMPTQKVPGGVRGESGRGEEGRGGFPWGKKSVNNAVNKSLQEFFISKSMKTSIFKHSQTSSPTFRTDSNPPHHNHQRSLVDQIKPTLVDSNVFADSTFFFIHNCSICIWQTANLA